MRVLVACEFSGVVREAFRKRGHEAWSCDLLASEAKLPRGQDCWPAYSNYNEPHFKGDVLKVIRAQKWNLMVAHPPCTFLCNSGVRWLYGGKGKVRDEKRWQQMEEAANFFRALLFADIPKIAIENPIMHIHARNLIQAQPSEQIQPYMFGHPETKATLLWLRGLPLLQPTNWVDGRKPRVHHASPGPERWKERSRTLQGIAEAMAEQWGEP